MALLKQGNSAHLIKNAVVLDLGDLQQEAERLRREAQLQAERITQQAQEEADQLIAQADERGYQQGLERGRKEGFAQGDKEGRAVLLQEFKPQLEQITESWPAALEQWEVDRREMFLAARGDVLQFSFALAQKIIARTVQTDGTVIEDQLAEALSMVSQPTSVLITIHPDDRETVNNILPELLEKAHNCEHADLAEDAAMQRGGCIVTTKGGCVDATIETQLDRIAQVLLQTNSTVREDHSSEPDTQQEE